MVKEAKMTKIKAPSKWLVKSLKIMSYLILAAVLIYEVFVGVGKLNAKGKKIPKYRFSFLLHHHIFHSPLLKPNARS